MHLSKACCCYSYYSGWVYMPHYFPIDFSKVIEKFDSDPSDGLLVQGPLYPNKENALGTSVCHVSKSGMMIRDQEWYSEDGSRYFPPPDLAKEIGSQEHVTYTLSDPFRCEWYENVGYNLIGEGWCHGEWTMEVDYSKTKINPPHRKGLGSWGSWPYVFYREVEIYIHYTAVFKDHLSGPDDDFRDHPRNNENSYIRYSLMWYNYPGNPNGLPAGPPSMIPHGTHQGVYAAFDEALVRKDTRYSVPSVPWRLSFLHSEEQLFLPFLSGRSTSWCQQHMAEKASAFLNACDAIPSLNSNTWANLIEIISLIKKLKHGDFSGALDAPRKWWEAWLQYRYRYSTTKSDLNDLKSLCSSVNSLSAAIGNGRTSVYGTFNSDGFMWRCKVTAVNKKLSGITEFAHRLDNAGLGITWYNLWDLIPYSFVVDWILPIGDILDQIHDEDRYSYTNYDFEEICYSCSYTRVLSEESFGAAYNVYDRWYEKYPPNLNQYYWFKEQSSTNNKTIIFRLIDGVSLLMGRR